MAWFSHSMIPSLAITISCPKQPLPVQLKCFIACLSFEFDVLSHIFVKMKAIVVGFLVVGLLAACSDSDNELNKSVTFETVEKNFYSGVEETRNVIVTNVNEWEALWDETVTWTPDELPFVNFNESVVIAVYMGEQLSGGFNVDILGIRETDEIIEVVSKFSKPESREGVTLALTQPFHMIKIQKTDKKIVFREIH